MTWIAFFLAIGGLGWLGNFLYELMVTPDPPVKLDHNLDRVKPTKPPGVRAGSRRTPYK